MLTIGRDYGAMLRGIDLPSQSFPGTQSYVPHRSPGSLYHSNGPLTRLSLCPSDYLPYNLLDVLIYEQQTNSE